MSYLTTSFASCLRALQSGGTTYEQLARYYYDALSAKVAECALKDGEEVQKTEMERYSENSWRWE